MIFRRTIAHIDGFENPRLNIILTSVHLSEEKVPRIMLLALFGDLADGVSPRSSGYCAVFLGDEVASLRELASGLGVMGLSLLRCGFPIRRMSRTLKSVLRLVVSDHLFWGILLEVAGHVLCRSSRR